MGTGRYLYIWLLDFEAITSMMLFLIWSIGSLHELKSPVLWGLLAKRSTIIINRNIRVLLQQTRHMLQSLRRKREVKIV